MTEPNPFANFSAEVEKLEEEKQAVTPIFGDGPVDFAKDAASSAVRGFAQGVDETVDFAAETGDLAADGIRFLLPDKQERQVQQFLSPASRFFKRWGVVEDGNQFGLDIDDGLDFIGIQDGRSRAAQMVGGFSQWAGGFVAGGKLLKATGNVTRTTRPVKNAVGSVGEKIGFKAGRSRTGLAKGVGQGIIGDFLGFDPHEERLSNMVQAMGVDFVVTDYLATDQDDGAFEGRFKQALEGAILGGMLEGVGRAVGKTKKAKEAVEKAKVKASEGTEKLTQGTKKALDIYKGRRNGTMTSEEAAEIGTEAGELMEEGARIVSEAEQEVAKQLELPFEGSSSSSTADQTSPNNLPAAADGGASGGSGGNGSGAGAAGAGDGAEETPFDIFVSPEKADEFMTRMRDNIRKTEQGIEFNEGYDPLEDLNLDRISDDGDFRSREAVHAMAKTLGDEMANARGGTTTFESVAKQGTQFAKDMLVQADGEGGLDVLAANLARVAGAGADIPKTIDGMRQLAESSRRRLLRRSQAYMEDRSNENLVKLFEDVQIMGNIQATVKGYSSQVGRALGQLRRIVRETDSIDEVMKNVDDPRVMFVLDPTGKSGTVEDAIDAFARNIRNTGGDLRRMSRVLEPSFLDRASRVTTTYYQASIMSNPGTLAVNFGGGLQQNVFEALDTLVGGMTSANGQLARQGVDELANMIPAVADATKFAFRAMRHNLGVLDDAAGGGALLQDTVRGGIDANSMGVNPETAIGRFLDGINLVTGMVFRPILFTDEFNKQLAFTSSLRARLLRDGRAMGLKGRELHDFVDNQSIRFRNPDTGAATQGADGRFLFQEGIDRGRAATFQEGLNSRAMRGLEDFMRGVPFMKILVTPFLRTPVNILKETARRTPGLRHSIDDVRHTLDRAKRPDATQADIEAAARMNGKMYVGSGLYMTFMALAASGVITGTGPANGRSRWSAQQIDSWQPFSLRVGDKFFSLTRHDPVSSHLMLAAAAHDLTVDAMNENPDDPDSTNAMQMAKKASGVLFGSFINALSDKTYLKGLSDWFDMIDTNADSETIGRRAEKVLGTKAGGFVPSVVSSAARDLNPNEDVFSREANNFLDQIQKRIPALENEVDVRYDIFGQPLKANVSWPTNMLNVTREGQEADETNRQVLHLMLQADVHKQGIPKSIDRIRITDIPSAKSKGQSVRARWYELYGSLKLPANQYSPYLPKGNYTLKEAVDALVETPEWQYVLTDPTGPGIQGTRLEEVGRLMTAYKSAAKKALIATEPELREAIQRRDLLKDQADEKGSDPISTEELGLRGRTSPVLRLTQTYGNE